MSEFFVVVLVAAFMFLSFLFLTFITLSIPALVIIAAVYGGKEAKKKWIAMAQELGYVHHPTKTLWGSEAIGPMTGRHGEFPVRIHSFSRGSGKHRSIYTAIETHFQEPLGMGLDVRPEGVLSQVGKMFGVKDMQVGDQRFDNLFLVRGDDGRTVLEFLTPEVRQEVLELRKLGTSLVLNDHGVYQEYSGVLTDASKVKAVLAGQLVLARAMSRVHQDKAMSREAEFEMVGEPAFARHEM